MSAPLWMQKHPCPGCSTGYGACQQTWFNNLMCCKECYHPTRWEPHPYTADDYREMWAGREDEMPEAVKRYIRWNSG